MNQQQALTILKQYSGIKIKNINSDQEKQELITALLSIVNLSDDQNLGICANNEQETLNTLTNYLTALNCQFTIQKSSNINENEPIYLKFSTERKSYTIENYTGEYRGVLITIFADQNQNIEGTYGYFPLNLFN